MKKHIVLISVGVLNVLHGSFHIVQFIQSMFFVAYATHDHHHDHDGFIESVMHNPIFALIMGVIGILTLVIGIKDYKHHKKCNSDHHHEEVVEPVELTIDEQLTISMKETKRLVELVMDKDKGKDGIGLVHWE